MDIPGFYYDSMKKKYFRVSSSVNHHVPLTNVHVNNQISIENIKISPAIDLPQSVARHELGQTSKFNLQEQALRSQLNKTKVMKTILFEPRDYMGNTLKNACCEYLIGSTKHNSLFALLDGDAGSVIHQILIKDILKDSFDIRDNSRLITCFPPGNKVVDFCEVYWNKDDPSMPNGFATLTTHFNQGYPERTSFSIDRISDIRNGVYLPSSTVYEFPGSYFCCCTHSDMKFAIGGENNIKIFSELGSNAVDNLNMKGMNVTSLIFNNDGNLLMAANNKGNISCFDLRVRRSDDNTGIKKHSVNDFKFATSSIVYLNLLSDGNRLLVSGHDNTLFMSDLRTTKHLILQFPGHVNNCKKIPISYDQTYDLMCSAGSDSIMRFWSLKNAKLLHEKPPAHHSWPLSNTQSHSRVPTSPPINHVWYSHSWSQCINKSPKPLIFTFGWNQIDVLTS